MSSVMPADSCLCAVMCPCCCPAVALQEAGDKQETDRNYENMWRQLKTVVGYGQTVPFINLVCNHKSFAQTVENIFTLSFLVRTQGRPWQSPVCLVALLICYVRIPHLPTCYDILRQCSQCSAGGCGRVSHTCRFSACSSVQCQVNATMLPSHTWPYGTQ
jgi:hypothetical protein